MRPYHLQEQLLNLPLGSNVREIQQSSKCHEKCERMFGTIKGKMKLPLTTSKVTNYYSPTVHYIQVDNTRYVLQNSTFRVTFIK